MNIPSVNQINAQIKLLEVWKSQHIDCYPMKWKKQNELTTERRTRGSQNDQILQEKIGSRTLNATFMNDAARIWNRVPQEKKN